MAPKKTTKTAAFPQYAVVNLACDNFEGLFPTPEAARTWIKEHEEDVEDYNDYLVLTVSYIDKVVAFEGGIRLEESPVTTHKDVTTYYRH